MLSKRKRRPERSKSTKRRLLTEMEYLERVAAFEKKQKEERRAFYKKITQDLSAPLIERLKKLGMLSFAHQIVVLNDPLS